MREPEGIVQHECGGTRELLASGECRELLIQVSATVVEGGGETLLPGLDDALDQADVLEQARVGVAHDVVHRVDETAQERVLDTQQTPMEHGATQQTAQHIATALVTGKHAIGDQEVHRTGVVGDDAQGAGAPV